MKAIGLILTVILIAARSTWAQSTSLEFEFVLDEKKINIKNKSYVKVKTLSGDMSFPIHQSKVLIPDSLRRPSQHFTINLNGYQLVYSDIPISWNIQYPKWIVTIDRIPLSEENLYRSTEAQKGLRWISVLNNGSGMDWTGLEYSKLTKSK